MAKRPLLRRVLNKKSVQRNDANNFGVADVSGVSNADFCADPDTLAAQLPLVVIVGPTASGKTAVALKLAKDFNGEIICADSRTIYKGMDIGTAKPTPAEQATVPHWGLDLVTPGELFTAADFQKYASEKIYDIRARGKIPFLVGGSGLYVDGVIFNYQFGKPNKKLREKLETLSLAELHEYCANNNILLPQNQQNRRYVIRAIEQKSVNNKRLAQPLPHTIIVGITTDPTELRRRITLRSEQLFAHGMVDEAKKLGKKYGWNSEAMTGNIYRLVGQFLQGEFDEAILRQKFITSDWQLAKKQRTWLKRNPYIVWQEQKDVYNFVAQQLSKTK